MATYMFKVITVKTDPQVRAVARARYQQARQDRNAYIAQHGTENGAPPAAQRTVQMAVWQAAIKHPMSGEWVGFGAGHEQKAVTKALNWASNCTDFTNVESAAEYDALDFDRD